MRADEPSLTARGVALARSTLDRPSSPTGDPAAEARLVETLFEGFVGADDDDALERARSDGFWTFLTARTRFFDDAVLRAIANGTPQVVVLGAGYDARALRFRTPGVRFFEVDHPATQRDKRDRLARIGAPLDGVTFVAADFTEPGLSGALASAGHRAGDRTLFLCEGVLRYLPEASCRDLLRAAAASAAPGSELAASIPTLPAGVTGPDEHERARRAELERSGEPVLTVPPTDVALTWVADAGWSLVTADDTADLAGSPAGTDRGRILVRAERR